MHYTRSKLLLFVVILFLAVTSSSYLISNSVFAATKGPIECTALSDHSTECCQTTTEDDGIEITWCTMCENTDPPSNCSGRYQGPLFDVAPPPSTTTSCPDLNQALDATGNCEPLVQAPEQPPAPTSPPTGGEGVFGSDVLPNPPAGVAPPTEPPAPTSEPTLPPETGQGEEEGTGGGGGIKPPVEDLLPDTGITEQPDVQQPEEPSDQGQDTTGPIT